MKLGFDIDDVICDLVTPLSAYIKEKYANVDWANTPYVRFDNCACSEDPEENDVIARDIMTTARDPEFQASLLPFDDAVMAIKRYKKLGHSIHFITARLCSKEQIAVWLRANKLPFDSIHTDPGDGKKHEKGKLGRVLNLDMYVDDLEENLLSMWRYKKRWRKGLLLFDRLWNQGPYDASKFTRVHNWGEIDRHLGVQNR